MWSALGQLLPSQDFCGTAALPPESCREADISGRRRMPNSDIGQTIRSPCRRGLTASAALALRCQHANLWDDFQLQRAPISTSPIRGFVRPPAIRAEQNHVVFFRRAALHPGEPIGMPGTARPVAFDFSARKRFRAVAGRRMYVRTSPTRATSFRLDTSRFNQRRVDGDFL